MRRDMVRTSLSRPTRRMRGGRRTGAWNSSSPSNDEAEAKMTRLRFVPTSFALALAMISFAGLAQADDQATIEKLVQMNKRALDDYDTLEWDGAKKTLIDALMLGKKAGLDNHPVMARTYCLLYTSPSPRDRQKSRMPSS